MARHSRNGQLAQTQHRLFSDTFLNRAHGPIFACGAHSLTLRELAHDLDCPFPHSARRLQRVLEEEDITSLKTLDALGINGLAALKGVGDSLCFVATVILDHFQYDIAEFTADEDGADVRFSTLKRQQHEKKKTARRKKRSTRLRNQHLPATETPIAASA